MADIPFLHPALIGVAVGTALVWAAVVPERLRDPLWAICCGVVVASVAAAIGWVPWGGSLHLTAYGVLLLAAFLVAWWWARRRARTIGIAPVLVREQLAIAALAGIVGARAWYVIEYHHTGPAISAGLGPWLAWAADLDRGGAVWFGGLLLAIAALVVHARRNAMPLAGWSDCAAPGVLAGLAIGRIGCFWNGCCYGVVSDGPLGCMRGPDLLHVWQHPPPPGVTVHFQHVLPTQLFESAACLVLALAVSRFAPGRGLAAAYALVGYGLWRFVIEMFRGDYAVNLGQGFQLWPPHVTSSQVTALVLAVLGGVLAWRAHRAPAAHATPA